MGCRRSSSTTQSAQSVLVRLPDAVAYQSASLLNTCFHCSNKCFHWINYSNTSWTHTIQTRTQTVFAHLFLPMTSTSVKHVPVAHVDCFIESQLFVWNWALHHWLKLTRQMHKYHQKVCYKNKMHMEWTVDIKLRSEWLTLDACSYDDWHQMFGRWAIIESALVLQSFVQ